MRGWTKALLWAGILLACAAVGAFVASRSNLFPPSVGGSDVPSVSLSPSPPAEPSTRWGLTMTSRTTHTYRSGGACRSDWRITTRIEISPAGRVDGRGVARLRPGADCDFDTAQVQARAIRVRFVGRRQGTHLQLRLEVLDVDPPGAQDLGGFLGTLPEMRFSIRERGGAERSERIRVREQEEEIQVSTTRLRLSRSGG